MFKRIDHVALHVSDLRRSVEFYEKHFGFKHYFQHAATGGMQIAYLKLGDTVLELTHKSDGPMTGFHFCLETDNFDLTLIRQKLSTFSSERGGRDRKPWASERTV
jgi:lactoylglutathione lyase